MNRKLELQALIAQPDLYEVSVQICSHNRGQVLKKVLESYSDQTLDPSRFEVVLVDDGSTDNNNRLGAVNDIKFAVERLNITQDLLVVAGDNVLDFSLKSFVEFAIYKNAPCVMCSEENDLQKQRKTAIITRADDGLITSYEEKPKEPKCNLAVPPFYYYRAQDVALIDRAIAEGCNTDAPGSFAAWISTNTPTYALTMPGKRYDIGDMASYELAQKIFKKQL